MHEPETSLAAPFPNPFCQGLCSFLWLYLKSLQKLYPLSEVANDYEITKGLLFGVQETLHCKCTKLFLLMKEWLRNNTIGIK